VTRAAFHRRGRRPEQLDIAAGRERSRLVEKRHRQFAARRFRAQHGESRIRRPA
jgi:hypothetical protein